MNRISFTKKYNKLESIRVSVPREEIMKLINKHLKELKILPENYDCNHKPEYFNNLDENYDFIYEFNKGDCEA